MYQQFCMVASITNFFDKKLYLPSAALPFSCLTNGKIQSVSNCFFLTEFVQENTFILQWAGGRQHLGMRDGKRRKFHRWKLDMIIPGIHTSHYLPGFWSDSDALVVVLTYRKCILRRAFIPWDFLQCQYHNPGSLNYLINRKFEQIFLDTCLNTSVSIQPSIILTLALVWLNWNPIINCFIILCVFPSGF